MITTSAEQFAKYLSTPEGTNLEFRAARGGYHFEELVDYCAALSHEGGGKIFLGILNAVSHRDYRLAGSTFVRQYARRLEVVSPGGAPSITVENVLD